jgi:hypothetical protein
MMHRPAAEDDCHHKTERRLEKIRRETGALSLMRPRALSRNIDCSSLRTSAISDSVQRTRFEIVIAGWSKGPGPERKSAIGAFAGSE